MASGIGKIKYFDILDIKQKGLTMPCMGPSDMRKEADQFIAEIAVPLKTKYGIDITKTETWGAFKDKYNKSVKELKTAIREMFKYDSYNGF